MYTFSIGNKEIKLFYSSCQRYFVPYLSGFNTSIFLCDLFHIINNINFTSYADNATPYTTHQSAEKVIDKLEVGAKSLLFKWFSENEMKANPDK